MQLRYRLQRLEAEEGTHLATSALRSETDAWKTFATLSFSPRATRRDSTRNASLGSLNAPASASFSILDSAASRSTQFLLKAHIAVYSSHRDTRPWASAATALASGSGAGRSPDQPGGALTPESA